jgi:hypothetical protein
MTDDHTAVLRLVAQIEATPCQAGWIARLRRASAIRHAEAMLDWEDARRDGPNAMIPIRNQLVGGFLLLWVGGTASGLFLAHHRLRYLALSAVPLALLLGWGLFATKLMWKATERDYTRFLARARALPAPEPDGSSGAAA